MRSAIARVLAAGAAWCAIGAAFDCAAAEPTIAQGRELFVHGVAPLPACALCHTLKDAGASGQIGPSLDELQPDADRVSRVIRSGMGPMPAFTALSDEEVDALARYVSTMTRARP